LHRDRPSERASVADPTDDLRAVALDLHAPPASVTELAARHVPVEILGRDLEARRQALEDARQARTVRLAGGCETKRHTLKLIAELSAPPGARGGLSARSLSRRRFRTPPMRPCGLRWRWRHRARRPARHVRAVPRRMAGLT